MLAATDDPASVAAVLVPDAGVMLDAPAVSPAPVSVDAVVAASAWVMAAAFTADPPSVLAVLAPSACVTAAAAVALAAMLAAVLVPVAPAGVVAAVAEPPKDDAVLVPSAWVIVESPPTVSGTQMLRATGANSCHGFSDNSLSSASDAKPDNTAYILADASACNDDAALLKK